MDMTNVERVIKAIEEGEFTVTHYPCRASIEIIGDNSMPDVLWFKETDDKITRGEGFYI